MKNGLTGDDWQLLFAYKTYDPQPLNRILDVWMMRGPYTTIQFYYIGLLEKLFGLDYQLFQIINISFKIFASITLYLLISKIFKNFLLATVSALIFTIIHSSTGALQYVIKGPEYLAIGFMNLFFLMFYYAVTKRSIKFTLLTSIILFVTFMLSPIRLYPLFGLIILIEIYLVIRNRKISYLLQSLFRLIIFYLPLAFLAVASINTTSGYLNGTINFINDLKSGSWHFFLAPFQGLGYSLLGNDQLKFLHTTASSIGIFLLAWSFGYFIVWLRNGSKLDKFFLLFIGPWFALFFLISTWIILGPAFNINESVHWYLIVPSLGISIFISALICSFFEKGYPFAAAAFLLFMVVSFISYHETNRHFNYLLSIGADARDYNYMQDQILTTTRDQDHDNLFIYLDGSNDPNNAKYYEVTLNLGYFEYWLFYFKKPNFLGCITYVTDKNKLIEYYRTDNGGYFESNGLCAETRYDVKTKKTAYDTKDFRAFMLKDKKMINITDQVLQDLRSGNTSF